MTDGPFAETKDLIAGWMVVDVDSYERATELAGELSAAPGAGRTDPRMAGGPSLPRRPVHHHRVTVSPVELRELVPRVLSVQEALIRALSAWEADPPSDPEGWLITVSWRAFLDMARADTARRDREDRLGSQPPTGAVPSADDTLRLYLLCAHPDLTSSSAGAVAPGRTEGSCRWPSRTAAAGTPGSSRRGSRRRPRARRYASAARNAPNLAERDHQTREAARLNQLLRTREHKT